MGGGSMVQGILLEGMLGSLKSKTPVLGWLADHTRQAGQPSVGLAVSRTQFERPCFSPFTKPNSC